LTGKVRLFSVSDQGKLLVLFALYLKVCHRRLKIPDFALFLAHSSDRLRCTHLTAQLQASQGLSVSREIEFVLQLMMENH
jgi:hypothetical protein